MTRLSPTHVNMDVFGNSDGVTHCHNISDQRCCDISVSQYKEEVRITLVIHTLQ